MAITDSILSIFGPLAILSLIGMSVHLTCYNRDKGVIRYWVWVYLPSLMAEYKNFTKQKYGKCGLLYYVFMLSVSSVAVAVMLRIILLVYDRL